MAKVNRWFHVVDGPSLMRMMLAHYDLKGGVHDPIWFGIASSPTGRCELSWGNTIITGSDVVEHETHRPNGSIIPVGAFFIRGWTNKGRTHRFEGWYDPRTRKGVLEIKPREDRVQKMRRSAAAAR